MVSAVLVTYCKQSSVCVRLAYCRTRAPITNLSSATAAAVAFLFNRSLRTRLGRGCRAPALGVIVQYYYRSKTTQFAREFIHHRHSNRHRHRHIVKK